MLIFGLPEEPEEQISEKVGKVLGQLGKKPRFKANRIGKKTTQQKPRPAPQIMADDFKI